MSLSVHLTSSYEINGIGTCVGINGVILRQHRRTYCACSNIIRHIIVVVNLGKVYVICIGRGRRGVDDWFG